MSNEIGLFQFQFVLGWRRMNSIPRPHSQMTGEEFTVPRNLYIAGFHFDSESV